MEAKIYDGESSEDEEIGSVNKLFNLGAKGPKSIVGGIVKQMKQKMKYNTTNLYIKMKQQRAQLQEMRMNYGNGNADSSPREIWEAGRRIWRPVNLQI